MKSLVRPRRVDARTTVLPADRAKPFLKWVGGKRQLIPQLTPLLPKFDGTYFEPFVGGGALFFHLRPARARLTDGNLRLIRTYTAIRDETRKVIRLLKTYPHDKASYLELRAKDVDAGSNVEVAAWMIYLNKTGFNGLYRVNKRDRFNVPFGDYAAPNICDEANLLACAEALKSAAIEHAGFESVLGYTKRGDFVYFDPPYVPLNATSTFTSYTAGGFGPAEQERLRDVALELKSRGVHVLLSNSSAPLVEKLYAKFELHRVQATRAINSKGSARGAVTEFLIR